MERIFFRERTAWEDKAQLEEPVWNLSCRNEKKKIAVVGISRGAGTTFVAMSLAFLLSKNVEKEQVKEQNRGRSAGLEAGAAYVELRQPAAGQAGGFFSAGLDLRFRRNRFTDFFQIYLQGRPLPPLVNLHKGINWAVWRTAAGSAETPAEDGAMHLIDFPLDDLSGKWIIADDPPLEMLHRFDLVIGVIDPLPSRVFAGMETYEALRDMAAGGTHILWIMNGDNPEVNHGELRRFLRLADVRIIPLADPAVFYRAQYASCLPVELLAAGSWHGAGDSGSRHAVYAALEAIAEEVAGKWKELL